MSIDRLMAFFSQLSRLYAVCYCWWQYLGISQLLPYSNNPCLRCINVYLLQEGRNSVRSAQDLNSIFSAKL